MCVCTTARRRGSVFLYSFQCVVLSMGFKTRGIHYNIPPESLCVLVEKGKDNTVLAGRR